MQKDTHLSEYSNYKRHNWPRTSAAGFWNHQHTGSRSCFPQADPSHWLGTEGILKTSPFLEDTRQLSLKDSQSLVESLSDCPWVWELPNSLPFPQVSRALLSGRSPSLLQFLSHFLSQTFLLIKSLHIYFLLGACFSKYPNSYRL